MGPRLSATILERSQGNFFFLLHHFKNKSVAVVLRKQTTESSATRKRQLFFNNHPVLENYGNYCISNSWAMVWFCDEIHTMDCKKGGKHMKKDPSVGACYIEGEINLKIVVGKWRQSCSAKIDGRQLG